MLYWGLAASAGVLSIIALIYDLEQMYFIAITVVALPWLSRWLSSGVDGSLRAAVQTSGEIKLHTGDPAWVRIAIYNAGRVPRALCRASLDLPRGLVVLQSEIDQADTLGPESATHLDVGFTPVSRGVYTVSGARVLTTDFMGVFEFTVRVPSVDLMVTAWPKLYPVKGIPWLENQSSNLESYDSHALDDGASHGEVATDFYGVRQYHPGDEIRRIHWPSTARHQEFTVIEYVSQQRGSVTIYLDLDASSYPSVGDDDAFETAVSLAATVAAVAIRQSIPVRVVAQGAEDHSLVPTEGIASLEVVLDRLALVDRDGTVPLDVVVRRTAWIAHEGGIILVTARNDGVLKRAQAAAALASTSSRTLIVDAASYAAAGAARRTEPVRGRNGALTFARGDDPVVLLEQAQ